MSNRTDQEYNKFSLEDSEVTLKTAEGVGNSSAVFGNIDDLESKKFTGSGAIRIINTF